MVVHLYKLDNPTCQYEWCRKIIRVDKTEDLIEVNGYMGVHIYTGFIFEANDDPSLCQSVVDFCSLHYKIRPLEVLNGFFLIMNEVGKPIREC